MERLNFARVESIIDLRLSREQTGFWHGMSMVDQVTLLTQKIEDSFLVKKKAGAVFVDLTEAYNTACQRGLTCKLLCKLLRLRLRRHMVSFIMELVRNRSFTPTTDARKQCKLHRLNNGVPQGSVIVSFLFNIYTNDLSVIADRNFLLLVTWSCCTMPAGGRH